MSGAEWAGFAGCGAACLAFLACVVWSVGKVGGWMKGGRDES